VGYGQKLKKKKKKKKKLLFLFSSFCQKFSFSPLHFTIVFRASPPPRSQMGSALCTCFWMKSVLGGYGCFLFYFIYIYIYYYFWMNHQFRFFDKLF
jgi:hypothetical protein